VALGAALHVAARLDLSSIGPTDAVSGQTGSFVLTATNSGLLIGTNLSLQLSLPAGTTVLGTSPGCTVAGALVTCTHESLAPGASASFTVQVRWNYTGPVTGSAVLLADQINASSSQLLALGGAEDDVSGDAPLPLWAIGLLALAMLPALRRRDQPGLARAARC
jgi:MYXO-CTERM domain-containing protein/uncharacterized repeat protein (TIGR01451 family)